MLRNARYVVRLTPDERQLLTELATTGKRAAAAITRARILLEADAGPDGEAWDDAAIADALDTSPSTTHRVRQAFVEDGSDDALAGKRPTGRQYRKLDGAREARRIAVACGEAPGGRARWTLQLPADRPGRVEGGRVHQPRVRTDDASKNDLKPWLRKQWVIPPAANAEFACAMADVLEVYQRPHDPDRPVVCLDETSKQLIGETRTPIPPAPGRPARIDYEYERHGTANLFMPFEPLAGWRHVEVTARRTRVDSAHVLRDLSGKYYPQAPGSCRGWTT